MTPEEANRSEIEFRVVHTLRCIGVSSEGRIAAASGYSEADTSGALGRLSDRGLATNASGPFGGWSLTEQGRESDEERLASELADTGSSDEVRRCYESFLKLNPVLLQVCGDWQMQKVGGTQMVNDHTDSDYDARVLSRLIRVDESAQTVCADLTSRLDRFEIYGPRLSRALERALAGETAYVADSFDSYHTVWFQLHEDLLTTLSISREDERQRPTTG